MIERYAGGKMRKNSLNLKDILKLINNVNKSKRRIKKNLYPLEYIDDGWRIILPASLPSYTFLKSGKTLLENAIVDFDNDGIYYWIPYQQPPNGITTPAMRLMTMDNNEQQKGQQTSPS